MALHFLASSFTTKELLGRCFTKANVTQFSYSLQSNYFSGQFHMQLQRFSAARTTLIYEISDGKDL